MISHIQKDSGWQIVTGPSINGRPDGGIPTIKMSHAPWVPDGLLLNITGVPGKYADGVARSRDYDIPANTGHAVLTAAFAFNEASLLFTQGAELGCKFTGSNDMTRNGQLQFSYDWRTAMMTLCLTSITGSGWTPQKVVLPKFTPNLIHNVAVHYILTDTGVSIPVIEIDGVDYPMPGYEVPGKELKWGKNKFQFNAQANTNQKGGTWEWMLYEVSVAFS